MRVSCCLPLATSIYTHILDKYWTKNGCALGRAIRDAKFDSRSARDKLRTRGKPYFRSIDSGLHLGYRKGKSGGKWLVRRYIGAEKYVVEAIGDADDRQDADGVGILTFYQAQGRARDRAREIDEAARSASRGPPVDVRTAIEEYFDIRERREEISFGSIALKRDARSRLTKHVLEACKDLASRPLCALTQDDLSRWREGLKMAPASVQRTVNDFKAALNAAAKRHKAKLPPTIRDAIKDGMASCISSPAVARERQVMSDADVRALIAAAWEVDQDDDWGGDLARVVLTLAATGGRFSQIVRMTVNDVQPKQRRLMVPASRKGRGEKPRSHIAVRIGDDVLAALGAVVAGRNGHEPLLLRPRFRQTSAWTWEKVGREPWRSASALTRPWADILKKAQLPAELVPYALRHSSIVRGLRAALPVRLVAALHDTSSEMIERHYSAYIIDAMDELAARAVVPLTSAEVVQLKRAEG